MTTDTIVRTLTQDDLAAEAKGRFGEDPLDWAFVCPTCGDIATGADWPEDQLGRLGQECIGRLSGPGRSSVDGQPERGCKTAAFGFFKGPWVIKMSDGYAVRAFALAPADLAEKAG